MKNYNPGIGILKFFAAFLVVWIHLGVRGVGDPHVEQFTIYSDALCRIAVPLFFIITGYYYIDIEQRIKPKLKKIILTTISVAIVYAGIFLLNHSNSSTFTPNSTWFFKFLLFNNFSPIGIHLWYLFALIYSLFFIRILRQHVSDNNLYIIALSLLITGCLINYTSYNEYVRNWIFIGIPNICLGLFLCQHFHYNQIRKIFLTCFILLVLLFLEVYLRRQLHIEAGRDLFIVQSFLAGGVILLIVNQPIKNTGVIALCARLGKHSDSIYYFHLAVYAFIASIVSFDRPLMIISRPFITFILTLALSIAFTKIITPFKSLIKKENLSKNTSI